MKSKQRNLLGRIIGGILLIAGIAAVFLYRVEPEQPADDTVIRPLKYMVVGQDTDRPMLFFPGTVEADREVDLSFEVGGRLLEFPVRRGMVVEEGAVLGRLDPTTFVNQVRNVEAELELARSSLARIERALTVNAVSQEEYARAAAAVQKAEAQLAIHQKALADTVLTARFDGRVSETYVNQFDTVDPGRAVLKLQDTKQLTLAVSVPETYIRWARSATLEQTPFVITFDALPEVRYPATLKEYATVADATTRTFRVRFLFEPDDNMLLLPGMTGALEVEAPDSAPLASQPLVPSDAVGFVSDGRAFVWALDPTEIEGVYAVRRQFIEPGGRSGTMIEALGVEPGTLIAVAGLTMLTEGHQVRLLSSAGETTP
ncbi:efflux RND transporter periplasmic adaptor subunit [Desulfobulbus alkaliphilus]|uniref:efflux RND transporter periplasmic adaptor subunit n=1 Tax=Desulfobulbus alkaliphilus TaxID=869814 RepID=UPI001966CBB1|nr:efflux RND transporter periplasmic adaptor subunit [Desulfobulbus alkaliphilus]MBM9536112.1 efflux RND transporter periplasmic adaptor subunit [Desulfobulbus alkaliphilus]